MLAFLLATLLTACDVQTSQPSVPLPTQSVTNTQTLTSQSVLAGPQILWPTQYNLPQAGAQQQTDKHLQQSNLPLNREESNVVSMNSALPQRTTMAQSPGQVHEPVVGRVTTAQSQPLSDNDSGLRSNPSPQSAPVESSKVTVQTHTTDCVKPERGDSLQSLSVSQSPAVVTAPTSMGMVTQVAPSAAQSPVVIVRQFQKVKPYLGQTSHKSFREHFERVAKANGWGTDAERMQNLALEGPALECLREVKEEEEGAYGRIWSVLARRFGHLDEPERAMRRFDARKQLEGESVAEFEQALRTLHREAWPRIDEESKDSALKRKFEEGLSSPDMVQFLRLHARSDDFLQTVAKARRFTEAQEASRPKKSVRIVESRDRDHSTEGTRPAQPNLQTLIDGFGQIIQTVLERTQTPSVATVNAQDESHSKPADGKHPVVPRKSRQEQQSPARGRSGRQEREGRPMYRRDNDEQPGNRNPGQGDPPGRPRGREGNSVSPRRENFRTYDQHPGPPNGRQGGYYRSSSADSYRSGAQSGQGQRPQHFDNRSQDSRYSDDRSQRSYYPRSGQSGPYQPRGGYQRSYQATRDFQRPQFANQGARPYNEFRQQEPKTYHSAGNDRANAVTPPPQQEPRGCRVCGEFRCHSDLHYGIRRNADKGCYVCGRYGCHSMFHGGQNQGPQEQAPQQSSPEQGNGRRGPRQGDRPPPQSPSRPTSRSASE